MEDKENKFCPYNIKECKNVDGALQMKSHAKSKPDTYEYHYRQRDDIDHPFFHPDNEYTIPHNMFQHCNSITIQQSLNHIQENQH